MWKSNFNFHFYFNFQKYLSYKCLGFRKYNIVIYQRLKDFKKPNLRLIRFYKLMAVSFFIGVQVVGGSNPLIPTNFLAFKAELSPRILKVSY